MGYLHLERWLLLGTSLIYVASPATFSLPRFHYRENLLKSCCPMNTSFSPSHPNGYRFYICTFHMLNIQTLIESRSHYPTVRKPHWLNIFLNFSITCFILNYNIQNYYYYIFSNTTYEIKIFQCLKSADKSEYPSTFTQQLE